MLFFSKRRKKGFTSFAKDSRTVLDGSTRLKRSAFFLMIVLKIELFQPLKFFVVDEAIKFKGEHKDRQKNFSTKLF
jgi:hypothetical protein